jgi:hypothetical protein
VHSRSARGIPITLIQNQLGSNALCFHHRQPSSSLTFRRSHVKTHYHYLRLLHTCICGALAGGRWAARVCIIVAALPWHRGGGIIIQPKKGIPRLLTPSPMCKSTPPNISYLFLLDPQTQISYRRPATRHSVGMTFLGLFQQYGGFRPWWRGLV